MGMGTDHEAVIARTLPHDPTAPSQARALVRQVAARLPATVAEDAQLLMSELVTNAVVHTLPQPEHGIHVWIRAADQGVYAEVRDAGHVRGDGTSDVEGLGVGLHLVEALASDWGAEVSGDGRTVWFELIAS